MGAPPIPADDLDHVLDQVGELWEGLRGTRTFLTGGTGFFGAWLVESFAHANEHVALDAELVVLSRDPDAAVERLPAIRQARGVSIIRGDVRDFDFPPGRFELVIHGAAESSQQGHVGDHRHMFDTIVDGTRRTLSFTRQAGAERFLLLSSGAVYGPQPPSMSHVSESYHGSPDLGVASSAYGEAKRAAEVLAAIEAERMGLSVRVARCFAFVGPHLPLDIHFAIGNFVRDAMARRPIRIQGDGTAVRSYLYMADLAAWLWTLAVSPNARGAYNVGSEEPLSILEVARLVAEVCGPGTPIEVIGKPVPGAPAHRYVPSTARARSELGLCQHVSVADGVRRLVGWHDLHPRPRP